MALFLTSSRIRSSRIMKFVALVSSSTRKREVPTSSASAMFAACETLRRSGSRSSAWTFRRQLPDHGRDVHPSYAATVLGSDLDRVGPRHHISRPSPATWS